MLDTTEGKVVGAFSFAVEQGHDLIVEGDWEAAPDRFGGEQFRAKRARLYVPSDPAELLAYAVSRTRGMGPSAQMHIWAAAGADWQALDIDTVPGLTRATRVAWRQTLETLAAEAAESQALAYLEARGCTPKQAARAWKTWRDKAVSIVTADCYRLTDLHGIGFRHVDDHVRAHYGIGDDDPRRATACVLYLVEQAVNESGETIADAVAVRALAMGMLFCSESDIDAAIGRLLGAGRLVATSYGGAAVLALSVDFCAESDIAEFAEGGRMKPNHYVCWHCLKETPNFFAVCQHCQMLLQEHECSHCGTWSDTIVCPICGHWRCPRCGETCPPGQPNIGTHWRCKRCNQFLGAVPAKRRPEVTE